jgi:hypothetical protein
MWQLQPSTYVPVTLNGCFSAALPTSGVNIMMLATTNNVLFIAVPPVVWFKFIMPPPMVNEIHVRAVGRIIGRER